jgi:pimeloyl-ACP methyl ester carboxylesterase
MDNVTVVLVHGAWHGAWCWSALQADLDQRGIASLAIDLPGHGVSTEPLGDLHGDAAAVAAVVDRLHTDVVLVGHSYGGGVISMAGALSPKVRHLVYLAAYVLDVGDSVSRVGILSDVAPVPPTLLGAAIGRGDGVLTLDTALAVPALYGDCPPQVVNAAVVRWSPQPIASFVQPADQAAWHTVPSTYVVCTGDRAVAPNHQRLMAARCGVVEELATDHSPFVSAPSATADIIERVVHG